MADKEVRRLKPFNQGQSSPIKVDQGCAPVWFDFPFFC
jgi:hypothetical protein